MLKLTIFGRHPVPQGGFNGVMSIFEAIEFSRLGYDTTLMLPFEDDAQYADFLTKHKINSLNELAKYGARFDIIPIFPSAETVPAADVTIYQSYEAKDWENYFTLLREKCHVLTKNYPKFVQSAYGDQFSLNQLKTFDVVACALREDYDLLLSNPEYRARYGERIAYVPRGASPLMLHPGYKPGLPPTIGFDVPNNSDIKALQHYVRPLHRLKKEFRNLSVLTVGRPVPELASKEIPFGRFDRMYELFFNRIHLYCTINYEFSAPHLQASIQSTAPGWSKKAIYEVQNVEAQMSGAVLVGHRDNIIEELYIPGVSGLNIINFDDEDHIYEILRYGLCNWGTLGEKVRAFAEQNFSWRSCIERWDAAIRRRINA